METLNDVQRVDERSAFRWNLSFVLHLAEQMQAGLARDQSSQLPCVVFTREIARLERRRALTLENIQRQQTVRRREQFGMVQS